MQMLLPWCDNIRLSPSTLKESTAEVFLEALFANFAVGFGKNAKLLDVPSEVVDVWIRLAKAAPNNLECIAYYLIQVTSFYLNFVLFFESLNSFPFFACKARYALKIVGKCLQSDFHLFCARISQTRRRLRDAIAHLDVYSAILCFSQ